MGMAMKSHAIPVPFPMRSASPSKLLKISCLLAYSRHSLRVFLVKRDGNGKEPAKMSSKQC